MWTSKRHLLIERDGPGYVHGAEMYIPGVVSDTEVEIFGGRSFGSWAFYYDDGRIQIRFGAGSQSSNKKLYEIGPHAKIITFYYVKYNGEFRKIFREDVDEIKKNIASFLIEINQLMP